LRPSSPPSRATGRPSTWCGAGGGAAGAGRKVGTAKSAGLLGPCPAASPLASPSPALPPTHRSQTFGDYKTRGPVVLKPSDTAELIEKLEDSQMQLGSMATNRSASYPCRRGAPPLDAPYIAALLKPAPAPSALAPAALHRYSTPFREQVQSWVVKLSTVSEILEQWLMVQVRGVAGGRLQASKLLPCGWRCAPACSSNLPTPNPTPCPHPHPDPQTRAPEHVAVHGGGLQRRRHRQATARGGQALPEHRQELHQGGLARTRSALGCGWAPGRGL
jgi:hypothetical protein